MIRPARSAGGATHPGLTRGKNEDCGDGNRQYDSDDDNDLKHDWLLFLNDR